MSWKDNLQKGRFRDASFYFEETDADIGRRVQLHEYPGRDLPYAEDLGRKARRWSMAIYVLGAEYMTARDALIRAFELPGSGTLVHPYLGSLQVVVLDVRGPRESTREGGMARFSVTFAESGDNRYPASSGSSAAVVNARADAASAAVIADFTRTYSVDGLPAFVPDAANALVQKAFAGLLTLSGRFPGVPSAVSAFSAGLSSLSFGLASLILRPVDLATSVQGILQNLAGLPTSPLHAINACRTMFTFGDDELPVPLTTTTRRQQAANQQAIKSLVKKTAVIEAARIVPTVEFDSVDQAGTIRDQIADAMDTEMETADDATYQGLASLRAAVVRDIGSRPDLARLITITPQATVPALVLAHRIYGDAARETDILGRNHIMHPGFVPGGAAIEVLSDV